MSKPVMRMEGVWKRLARRTEVQTFAELIHGLPRRLLGRRNDDGLLPHEFWALRDMTLQLMQGESLGIMGPNGAGKSSILKLLFRIFSPDRGTVEVNGRVTGLIELGAGFHPMLSGRDNVFINGAILGLKQREIRSKYDSIVEFAELTDYMDMPVKNYSSGMHARLAFAIAAHAEPSLLLVDEVLAVGDASFQNRCYEWIEQTRSKGCAIVMVSHQTHTLQSASRCLYINEGRPVMYGQPREVIDRYMRDQAESMRRGEADAMDGITRVELLDSTGETVHELAAGAPARFRMHVNLREPVKSPVLSLELVHDDPRFLISTPGANLAQLSSGDELAGETAAGECRFDVDVEGLHLPIGVYNVRAALKSRDALAAPVRNERALSFEVLRPPESISQALMDLDQRWSVSQPAATEADG